MSHALLVFYVVRGIPFMVLSILIFNKRLPCCCWGAGYPTQNLDIVTDITLLEIYLRLAVICHVESQYEQRVSMWGATIFPQTGPPPRSTFKK